MWIKWNILHPTSKKPLDSGGKVPLKMGEAEIEQNYVCKDLAASAKRKCQDHLDAPPCHGLHIRLKQNLQVLQEIHLKSRIFLDNSKAKYTRISTPNNPRRTVLAILGIEVALPTMLQKFHEICNCFFKKTSDLKWWCWNSIYKSAPILQISRMSSGEIWSHFRYASVFASASLPNKAFHFVICYVRSTPFHSHSAGSDHPAKAHMIMCIEL